MSYGVLSLNGVVYQAVCPYKNKYAHFTLCTKFQIYIKKAVYDWNTEDKQSKVSEFYVYYKICLSNIQYLSSKAY